MKAYTKTFFMGGIGLVFTILGIVSLLSSPNNNPNTFKGKPIEKVACSSSINTSDLKEVYGDADYVVIAKVVSENKVIYKNVTEMSDGSTFGIPYTEYTIEVTDNLKGKLPTTEQLKIKKAGGLTYDKEKYSILEDDILPEENCLYAFALYAQPDGSLLASGEGSTYKVAKDILGRKKLQLFEDSCKNAKVTDRKRYSYHK